METHYACTGTDSNLDTLGVRDERAFKEDGKETDIPTV
jgi:hypothetical protein